MYPCFCFFCFFLPLFFCFYLTFHLRALIICQQNLFHNTDIYQKESEKWKCCIAHLRIFIR